MATVSSSLKGKSAPLSFASVSAIRIRYFEIDLQRIWLILLLKTKSIFYLSSPCSPASTSKPSLPDLSMTLLSGDSCTQPLKNTTPSQNQQNNGSFKTLGQTDLVLSTTCLGPSHPGVPCSPWQNNSSIYQLFTSLYLISLLYIFSPAGQSGDFPVDRFILKPQRSQENKFTVNLTPDVGISEQQDLSGEYRVKESHKDERGN